MNATQTMTPYEFRDLIGTDFHAALAFVRENPDKHAAIRASRKKWDDWFSARGIWSSIGGRSVQHYWDTQRDAPSTRRAYDSGQERWDGSEYVEYDGTTHYLGDRGVLEQEYRDLCTTEWNRRVSEILSALTH